MSEGLEPLFSEAEIGGRLAFALALVAELGADALLVYGAAGSHADLQYLSGFPVANEAALILPAAGEPVLLVNYFNHVPTARALARIEDVRWGGDDIAASAAVELARRGARRVAVAGPLPWARSGALREFELVDAGPALARRRAVRSEAELAYVRRAAALSDAAVAALAARAHTGMTEHELAALVEAEWTPHGARTGIHYIGVTAMEEPALAVPAQVHSGRRLRDGDAVVVELSASVAGYWGQVLRTYGVGSGPTPLYAELHAVASAAFEAVAGVLRDGVTGEELAAAGEVIERAGFTIVDDLVHVGGGGVYAPYVRTRGAAHGESGAVVYREGMAVVVQPNVVTPDLRAGVQHGELVVIRRDGVERVHAAPAGMLRIGR